MAVLDYTEATALADGRILARVRRAGAACGTPGLITAAHAVEDSGAVDIDRAKLMWPSDPARPLLSPKAGGTLTAQVLGADASGTAPSRGNPVTGSTPDMIVSGVPYAVTDLEGQEPAQLADFTGPVTVHADGPTGQHEICGSGEHEHDGAVRLHEKDHHGTGKDVRVWTVTPATDHDGFVAAG